MLLFGGDDDPNARGFHRCGPDRLAAPARLDAPAASRPPRRDEPAGCRASRSRAGCVGSGSRRCATCCCTRRAATRAPSTRSRSRSSGEAEGEVAIEGRVVSARARPLRGRRTLVTAIVRDDSGATVSASFFNQPWLAEKLVARHAAAAARQARPLRLRRRRRHRRRRGARDRRLRARSTRRASRSRRRACASSCAPRSSEHARDLPDPLPAELELPLRRDALAALHFPADDAAGRAGAPAARPRRAARAAARRARGCAPRRRGRAVARPARRAGRPLPRRRCRSR